MAKLVKVEVQFLDGDAWHLDWGGAHTVQLLKNHIEAQKGMCEKDLQVVHGVTPLQNHQTLEDVCGRAGSIVLTAVCNSPTKNCSNWTRYYSPGWGTPVFYDDDGVMSHAPEDSELANETLRFVRAASCGDADAVRSFLAHGVNPNGLEALWRGMVAAAECGHLRVCDDIDCTTRAYQDDLEFDWRSRCLVKACAYGHVDIVNFCLHGGADREFSVKEFGGYSGLHVAAFRGHRACVQQLLTDDCHVESTAGGVDFDHLELVERMLDARDDGGGTPLMCAALGGHLEIVDDLLRYGANASAANSDGFDAAACADLRGNKEVAGFLRSRKLSGKMHTKYD